METRYFKYKGKEVENFPITSDNGKIFYVHNNVLGGRIVFTGSWEECQEWNLQRLLSGLTKVNA
jgi:hypothetical protein